MHEKVALNYVVPPGSYTEGGSVLPVSPPAAPCLAPAQHPGSSQVLFTTWKAHCGAGQFKGASSQFRNIYDIFHTSTDIKTNTAWHQFSQISPKYSTLLLHTRYTKKSYSLWGLTLCVYHVPEQPGSVPLAPTSTPPCHPLQGANRAVELK